MANKQKYPMYEVGDKITTNGVDLEILDIKRVYYKDNKSHYSYKYKCNKCGFDSGEHYVHGELKQEYWVDRISFAKNPHCICCESTCGSSVVVPNINSIVVTDTWMIPFFKDKEMEAKKYKKSRLDKIFPMCPCCGKQSQIAYSLNHIYTNKGFSCKYCGDGIPYPEKVIHALFDSIETDCFISQFNKTKAKWCGEYRYDFYFEYENEKYIIETHGKQHYEETTGTWIGSLFERKERDKEKYELAINNGINENNYIIIDCRKSDFEYIKSQILQSKLSKIFNLKEIDWSKVEKLCLTNTLKRICDLFNDGLLPKEIANKVNMNDRTVKRYLVKGTELGMCEYDSNYHHVKISKPIAIYKDGILLGEFPSVANLIKVFEKDKNIHLEHKHIKACVEGKKSTYKGYTFTLL